MILSFPFELKELDEAGLFTGLASTYSSEPDLVGDVVAPQAFAKTLAGGNSTRPLLLSHKDPIGTVKLSDTPQGLLCEGRLSLGVQTARDAYTLLKDGCLRSLSIGYSVVRDTMKGGVRHLLEVKLWEVSLCAVGANPEARIVAVKNLDEVRHALTTFQNEVAREFKRRPYYGTH